MSFLEIFHTLHLTERESLPEQMNNPFDYEPHPLCRRAAVELCEELKSRVEWSDEIAEGKMFGVLVVRKVSGEVGYLAAFSGNLAGTNQHNGFVPPIYDMLQPDDRFRRGEFEISEINRRIATIESEEELTSIKQRIAECEERAQREIALAKRGLEEQKRRRDAERSITTDPSRLEALVRESQFRKAEFVRLKRRLRDEIDALRAEYDVAQSEITALRSERKRRSEELQMWIFEQFKMLNARGESRNLCEIFAPTPQRVPPAGAGECAAPKLLQYAYQNELQPLAMAEFWQGSSPRGEVRRAGKFYPSCQGKCGPILGFMLQGLDIEKGRVPITAEPTLIYDDETLAVVSKPARMLSVDGRSEKISVASWARGRFAEAERVMVVHRLDMATSGLLVIAKSLDAYRALQAQFNARTIEKRYLALLEGVPASEAGSIELPISADYENRPRQRIDFDGGKRAVTEYRVLERRGEQTLVEFHPITGRTHQLRLHAAHAEGLNTPIVGDTLYGKRAERLCLHASQIAFIHPQSGERVEFCAPCEF